MCHHRHWWDVGARQAHTCTVGREHVDAAWSLAGAFTDFRCVAGTVGFPTQAGSAEEGTRFKVRSRGTGF